MVPYESKNQPSDSDQNSDVYFRSSAWTSAALLIRSPVRSSPGDDHPAKLQLHLLRSKDSNNILSKRSEASRLTRTHGTNRCQSSDFHSIRQAGGTSMTQECLSSCYDCNHLHNTVSTSLHSIGRRRSVVQECFLNSMAASASDLEEVKGRTHVTGLRDEYSLNEKLDDFVVSSQSTRFPSPDVGIASVLQFPASKCHDPATRGEAVSLPETRDGRQRI